MGVDGEMSITENYGINAPYKFTGKISKVTVDLREMKKPDKTAEDKGRMEAVQKKTLSD